MKPHLLLVTSLVLVGTLLGSIQTHTSAGQPLSIPRASQPDSLLFTLKIPAPPANPDGDRTVAPSLAGFAPSGSPGDPLLPAKAINLALPPDVIPESVQAQVLQVQTVDLPKTYDLAPAPPATTWVEQRQVTLWGKNADRIVDDKNAQVYQTGAYFPQSQLSAARFDQLRKWRFVSLLLTPLQYNPLTGKLRLATEVQIQVNFERAASPDPRQRQIELSDTVMDERAAQLLDNFDQAQAWYPLMTKPDRLPTYDYVIITTNFIVANNYKLNSFIDHKNAQGYSVLLVTEDDYGGLTGQWPNRTAQKIRQWLKNNYMSMSIKYVLLIGDPTPYDPDNPTAAAGAVPMRMCWPARRFLDANSQPLGQNIPTDYLYANLSGNWDLNSNGQTEEYCGELTDDGSIPGDGGMSFAPELYVGRIPLYMGNFMWPVILDYILDKTILYEDSDDLTWRDRALLPMSFLDNATDGAYLAEAMKTGYLNAAGYDSYTLYQHYLWGAGIWGANCYSPFSSNQDLVDNAVLDHWKNRDYGIVAWWGHGDSKNANIGYGLCSAGAIMSNADAATLDSDATHPAIVFAASEENGNPMLRDNLGYMLLFKGAVASISASRNTFYNSGYFVPSRSAAANASMAYYVTQRIVDGEKVGSALYDEIFTMSQLGNWDAAKVSNWIAFNLYGDPSLSIKDGKSGAPNPPSGLTAASIAKGIKLTWTDNSDNELGFTLQRGPSLTGPWTQIASPGLNTTEWTDSLLSCGTYYYRIQAYNATGASSYTTPATQGISENLDEYEPDNTLADAKFIIPTGSGSSPQTHIFGHSGTLDWAKFNALEGKVYDITTSNLGLNSDTYLELYDSTGALRLAYNDDCTTGPDSCITDWPAPSTGLYYIKVTNAADAGGCTGFQYDLAVKEKGYALWPTQPTGLTATSISHCQVNLAWTNSSPNANAIEVQRFSWKPYGMGVGMYLWQKIATLAPTAASYSDAGLECDKTYPYRVRANNIYGKSYFSNEASATTNPADTYEFDDTYDFAKPIIVNGTPQYHNFDVPGDVDWVEFTAQAGQVYTITTSNLGSLNDTELKLYDKNGTTQLAYNDDCAGPESCIKKWVAPSSGEYHVQVYGFAGKGGCPGYQYTLAVTGTSNSTSLQKPSAFWLSNWTVSTATLAWADTAITAPAYQVERWEVITGTRGHWRRIGIQGPSLSYRSQPETAISSAPASNYAFTDYGLSCNSVYTYQVRAFDELGASAYSDMITVTTPLWDSFEPDDGDYTHAQTIVTNTLGAPLQNHNLGPGFDTDWFKFTAQAGEVYTITTSQFTHSDNLTPTLELFGDPTALRLASTQQCLGHPGALCLTGWTAPAGGLYYIRLSGQGGCPGHDYFLNVVTSHLSASWPAAPTVFTGTLSLPDTIHLTWSDASMYDHLGFRLERRLGTGWLQVADLSTTVASYSDAGLACGQPYQYRLFANNASGNSPYLTLNPISTPACLYPISGNPLFLPTVRR